MSTTNTVVLTGVVVALGRWAQGKPVEFRMAIGALVLALFLAAMDDASPKLASQFGALVLVTALLIYAVPIAQKLGYRNSLPGRQQMGRV
jgi:hypothetical protein